MVLDTVRQARETTVAEPASGNSQRGGFLNRSHNRAGQLPEAGAVSLLRPRLQSWQIIVGEAFESFFIGSSGIPTTIEPTMFIEKAGEELLGGGLRGGMGGSPDFLAAPLETHQIGRTALIDGRHWLVLILC